MSGIAGDAHIWTITASDVPVAECGYSPPTQDILDPDGVVVGVQIAHAAPTGNACPDCVAAAGGEPEPEE